MSYDVLVHLLFPLLPTQHSYAPFLLQVSERSWPTIEYNVAFQKDE